MGKSQRTKGAVFERDIAKLFTAALRPEQPFQRNIGQARDGGCDINVGPLMVECKRRASLKVLRQWVQQATVSKGGTIPVVVMREDGGDEPMVLLRFRDFIQFIEDAQMMPIWNERA